MSRPAASARECTLQSRPTAVEQVIRSGILTPDVVDALGDEEVKRIKASPLTDWPRCSMPSAVPPGYARFMGVEEVLGTEAFYAELAALPLGRPAGSPAPEQPHLQAAPACAVGSETAVRSGS